MSWIFYTILAIILQTFRNLEQKSLSKKLDALTVSWSRFILPLPFAIFTLIYTVQSINYKFIYFCLITALTQVGGNICLLKTFKSKNFSIGIAFYKTEILQTLIMGLVFFGATIDSSGVAAILVASIGVMLMSGSIFNSGIKKFLQSLGNEAAFYGLLCGFCFSISSFNLKFAAEELFAAGYLGIKSPIIVLMWVICFQNILFISIKLYQKRLKRDFLSLASVENKSSFLKTSILSFSGSVCWFAAFAFGSVIYIKAVGQLELVLALLASWFILHEKITRIEFAGIVLTSGAILWLLLSVM